MPKILRVRAPQDEKEERWVRKLAASRHGPADWIVHALMVAKSWDGQRVEAIGKRAGLQPADGAASATSLRCGGDRRIGGSTQSRSTPSADDR